MRNAQNEFPECPDCETVAITVEENAYAGIPHEVE